MTLPKFSESLLSVSLAAFAFVLSAPAFAQGPLPDAPKPAVEAAPSPFASLSASSSSDSSPYVSPAYVAPAKADFEHRFWDNQNRILFAGVAASNVADFAVTYTNLQSGGRELNPVVRIFGRSAPGLALNFGGQTASVMGFAYFLHKTGHHKLERLVSVVNIGASMGAVTYGLTHR